MIDLPPDGIDLPLYIADLERSFINKALEDTDGNVTHSARLLSLKRTTLIMKMKKYGIETPKAEQ